MMNQTKRGPRTWPLSSTLTDLIPPHIRRSRLMLKGGYDICENLLDAFTQSQLLSEALRLSKFAQTSYVPQSDDEEVRGGNPARRFLSMVAGETQRAFYHDSQVLNLLDNITGIHLAPSGDSGTYTYYARCGDYLAIHRDIEICDVAVISSLYHGPKSTGEGGMLALYPTRLTEPLSIIRSTSQRGILRLKLMPGQTIVMLGGIVPHAVLPMTRGQVRIVSVLCYRDSLSPIRFKS